MEKFKVGIAGLGVVGSGVVRNVRSQADLLASRSGCAFDITTIAVKDPSKSRDLDTTGIQIITDPLQIARDPEIQIVVELMGGTGLARELVCESLRNGKAVVTANKALLAECGEELLALAASSRKPLCFEASVAGGIPILKALREGLIANRILSLHGIINGTCNYILSQIAQTGASYADSLAEAQKLGFAEADPTLDVEGYDAMHKTIVLAALAYGFWIPQNLVRVEGISRLQNEDFSYAKMLGYTIKLLGTIRSHDDGAVEAHVSPTFIPRSHVLASVGGSFNALSVRGDVVGDTLYYGRGAGSNPTASAVISDMVEAALALSGGVALRPCATHSLYAKVRPFDETSSAYYTRLSVLDQPGTLAKISAVFAEHNIGISSVFQPKEHPGDFVSLILLSDRALERDYRGAIATIERLPVVSGSAAAVRVEEFES